MLLIDTQVFSACCDGNRLIAVADFTHGIIDKVDALARTVHHSDVHSFIVHKERHTREACACADVDELLALEVSAFYEEKAVRHVTESNLTWLCDVSKVHHAVFFHQQFIISVDTLKLIFVYFNLIFSENFLENIKHYHFFSLPR